MRRNKAVELLLSKGNNSNIITLLMCWDSKFTIRDNSVFLGISRDSAYHFAVKYKLEYVKVGAGNNYKGVNK